MKKMMLVAAACAIVAAPSGLLADENSVSSVNVVGYYSVTIPANGVALVTPVLENMEGATVADLLGDQLPTGSSVYLWNRSSKGYISAGRTRSGWTGDAATNVVLRGDALWLVQPKDDMERTVTFMGEVPSAYNLAQTTTVFNISGADAVGYAYPVNIMWTNTTLSTSLPVGSSLYAWDSVSQGYLNYGKTRSGWGTGDTLEIKAGQGFWVVTSTPLDWEEVAPYEL